MMSHRVEGVSTITASSRAHPSTDGSRPDGTASSGGDVLPAVASAIPHTAMKLPIATGVTVNKPVTSTKFPELSKKSPMELQKDYEAASNELAATEGEISAAERVLQRLREALPVLEAGGNGGGDAERSAHERRRAVEEAKTLQARAHRERLEAIHQRSEDTIKAYRANAIHEKDEMISRQREVLSTAIQTERSTLEDLRIQEAQQDNGDESQRTLDRTAEMLESFLSKATTKMREDVAADVDDNLKRHLDSSLSSIRTERVNAITEGREARVRAFQRHKIARVEIMETHKTKKYADRKLRADEVLGAVRAEWDAYLMSRRIQANEAARNYDASLRDDFDRISKSSSGAVKQIVDRHNSVLQDMDAAARKRTLDLKQSNAAEMVHLQRLLDSERQAVTQALPAASNASSFLDRHTMLADFPEADALSIHARRMVDEVDLAIHSTTLQSDTQKIRRSVEEHEAVIADLYRHIHGQKDNLMRDWLRVQQLLSQLETDADVMAKRAAHGRSSIQGGQHAVDATANAWEKELRRMLSRCLAGGPDAYVQRGEDVVGQVLFQCNAKLKGIQRSARGLMAARREVEQDVGDAQALLDDERDKERHIILNIVRSYEELAAEAENVDARARKLDLEEAELEASRRALQEDQARIRASMQHMQSMATHAQQVTKDTHSRIGAYPSVRRDYQDYYITNSPKRRTAAPHSSGSSRSTSNASSSARHVALLDKYRHLYDDNNSTAAAPNNLPYGGASTTTSTTSGTRQQYPQQGALYYSSSSNDLHHRGGGSLTTPSAEDS